MSQIEIKVSKDEAIILFEVLTRFSEENNLQIEDEVETKVLWSLQAELEKVLVEPFQENYIEKLNNARNNVRNKG